MRASCSTVVRIRQYFSAIAKISQGGVVGGNSRWFYGHVDEWRHFFLTVCFSYLALLHCGLASRGCRLVWFSLSYNFFKSVNVSHYWPNVWSFGWLCRWQTPSIHYWSDGFGKRWLLISRSREVFIKSSEFFINENPTSDSDSALENNCRAHATKFQLWIALPCK